MKKKTLALLLGVFIVFGLATCGGEDPAPAEGDTQEEQQEAETIDLSGIQPTTNGSEDEDTSDDTEEPAAVDDAPAPTEEESSETPGQENAQQSTVTPAPDPVTPTPTPAPSPDPVPDTEENAEGTYVGSIESDKYHYPTCRHAQKITTENEIWFGSIDEASAAGYSSCGTCKPG